MKFQRKQSWLPLLSIIALSLGLGACSKDDASDSTYSYAGPGSNWGATIRSDGTFTITESDSSLTVEGTHTTLSSGFMKLTVTSATGADAPSAGQQAYAVNIPGVVFLLKPIGGGENQIIPMVASGSCPTSDQNLNWVQMSNSHTIDSSTDVLGTYAFDFETNTPSLPNKYNLAGGDEGTGTISAISCSAGVATVSGGGGGGGGTMYLTASGGAIVKTTNSTIMAMPSGSVSTSVLAGDYVGLVFSGGDDHPVNATMSSGSLTVASVNADTGAAEGSITSTVINGFTENSPAAGFLSGQFAAATSEKVVCMAQADVAGSGKNYIFCIGDDPTVESAAGVTMFSALFVSK